MIFTSQILPTTALYYIVLFFFFFQKKTISGAGQACAAWDFVKFHVGPKSWQLPLQRPRLMQSTLK